MKKWLNDERERKIIELYEVYENALEVANELGVCDETIYRALRKHGIKRTHRHDDDKKPKTNVSHCRSKYCPALIVMLHRNLGYSAREIADVTGYGENGVRNVLSKRGALQSKTTHRKRDFDLDAIEREYLSGVSGRDIAKRIGVSPSTVSGWMRERGIRLGKGAHQERRKYGDAKLRHEQAEIDFAKRLHDEFDGRFEYIGGFRENDNRFATIRCTECGYEFEHHIGFQGVEWVCPRCEQRRREEESLRREREAEQKREARRYERMFEELREYALDKTCKECGSTFHSKYKTALYCSDACRCKASNRRKSFNGGSKGFRHYYRHRYGKGYRNYFDPSITLNKLYKRDGGVCQICGEPCDWNDRTWGTNGPKYPSVDHIIPRAKGGAHHWSNVQLAHCYCNSLKSDSMELMACG